MSEDGGEAGVDKGVRHPQHASDQEQKIPLHVPERSGVEVQRERTSKQQEVPLHVPTERDSINHSLLDRVHFIVVMIRLTGLAPLEFEFLFPGSLASTFLGHQLTYCKWRIKLPFKIQKL